MCVLPSQQSRAAESMKMMGLTDFSYNLSWFIFYLFQLVIISVECTLMPIGALIVYSNPGVMFIFYFLYGLSLFGFGFFLQ